MQNQGGLSDADLVRWALGAATTEERKAAFEAIADRYHLTVFRQCARWFPHPEEAQDVCQHAFEAAFTLLAEGKAPERPDKLAGWLIEIARRRGLEYRRKDRPSGVSWAVLPEGQSLEETADDDEPRSGSAVRRAHAARLVEAVAATLTARQQQVYHLRIVEELTGRQVAERLGVSDKTASNEITRVQDLIATGFGALILFQEGRRYCPDLARIIETVPATARTDAFTTVLREQIVRHFDNCNICDDCSTCNNKRRELVGPYAPALIPILFAADMRDRILEVIERLTRKGGHSQPGDPEAALPSGTGTMRRNATPAAAGTAAAGAALLAERPDKAAGGGPAQLGRAIRRRPALSALAAVIILAAAGGAAAALASSGSPPAGSSVAAAATRSGIATAPPAAGAAAPGVTAVDVEGTPLSPQILAIARQVLAAARAHDSAALDKLLGNTTQTPAALNAVLAQPGVYTQIITLLTKTHAVSQDGQSSWPGFLLGVNNLPNANADLQVVGAASPQAYTGIVVEIGGNYMAHPYVPKLASINFNPA
ncbi:MAG TPA: sigma-70 family RNA polymerase sigma factor [Trebonia sp.]|nr:sigma-70 family RNA polymerase sigma factor [Trebonia sp.]